MAKGLLPVTHGQGASAARSFVLPESDVVLLIGARLNWLLSQGKGKTWGGATPKSWGGQLSNKSGLPVYAGELRSCPFWSRCCARRGGAAMNLLRRGHSKFILEQHGGVFT